MVSGVLNQGLAGMQSSQREMLKAASEIAQAALPVPASQLGAVGMVPARGAIEAVGSESVRSGGLIEPLIEMQRQELVFTASAKVVSVANKTLGSLLDATA